MEKYMRHFTTVGDQQPGKWSELDETPVHVGSDELSPASTPVKLTFRDHLKRLFTSNRFQIIIVMLVVLDALFVLLQLLLDPDLGKIPEGETSPPTMRPYYEERGEEGREEGREEGGERAEAAEIAAEVFEFLSLAVISFFLVELAGKLYTFRREFFDHKFEVFDGIIVIISFVLDIVSITGNGMAGVGLVVVFRLWRVVRIINSIILSVKNRADHKLHQLKESYDHLVKRVTDLQERNDKLEQENSQLQGLLKQNGIEVKLLQVKRSSSRAGRKNSLVNQPPHPSDQSEAQEVDGLPGYWMKASDELEM